jgi:hypothetical protein
MLPFLPNKKAITSIVKVDHPSQEESEIDLDRQLGDELLRAIEAKSPHAVIMAVRAILDAEKE